MKIVLLALYNFHSYAIRGFHGFLKDRGYDVESVYFKTSTYKDAPPKEQEIVDLVELIESRKPDVVAVSVHSPLFNVFKKVSIGIREKIGCKIMIGGEHPTALPEDCLPYADYVIVGEGENLLIDLAEGNLKEGISKCTNPIEDLDESGFPYYEDGTFHYGVKKFPKTNSYVSGRGCPYRCSYCTESVKDCSLRRKSVDRVIEDIKLLSNMFNLKEVFFSDSIFTLNKKWLAEFCEKFPRLGLPFVCYGHSVGMDKETVLMMKEAGLACFRTGIQSGSDYIRSEVFNRKDNLEDILTLAWSLYINKIVGSYDFIVNNPYDDRYTLKETRDFIDRLPPYSGINCFELRWFPQTPLTNNSLRNGCILEKDVEGQYNRFGHWEYSYGKGTA